MGHWSIQAIYRGISLMAIHRAVNFVRDKMGHLPGLIFVPASQGHQGHSFGCMIRCKGPEGHGSNRWYLCSRTKFVGLFLCGGNSFVLWKSYLGPPWCLFWPLFHQNPSGNTSMLFYQGPFFLLTQWKTVSDDISSWYLYYHFRTLHYWLAI